MNPLKIPKGLVSISLYAFFAFFLVLAVNNNAYADTGVADEAVSKINSIIDAPINFTGEDRDYAQVWFKDIFGDFIFAPWDSQYQDGKVTLISHAVGFTNILAMILGIVIVYYVIIGGALNTAQQGEALGKEWSTVWLPIRTMTGFALIMPMQTIGGGVLSFAQVFIIWLIMLGSNAATVLWNESIVHITSSSASTEPDIHVGYLPSHKMFKMLMCTEHYIKNRTRGRYSSMPMLSDSTNIINLKNSESSKGVYASVRDENENAFRLINSGVSFSQLINQAKPTFIEFADGNCGSISFGLSGDDTNEDPDAEHIASDYKIQAMDESRNTLRSLTGAHLDELLAIIKDMYERKNEKGAFYTATAINNDRNSASGDSDGKLIFLEESKKFYMAAQIYSKNLVPMVHATLSGGSTIKKKFLEDIKKGGWGKAGVWFFEIGALPGLTYKVMNEFLDSISVNTPSICVGTNRSQTAIGDCNSAKEDMGEGMLLADSFLSVAVKASGSSSDDTASVSDQVISDCSGGSTCAIDGNTINRMSTDWAKAVLNHLSSNNGVGDTTTLSSPFETVTSIGHSLNNYAAIAWGVGAAFNGFMEGIGAAKDGFWGTVGDAVSGSATSVTAGFFIGVGKWMLMSIVALATAMLSTGFVLAYLIPFLPVVTWIMMITGYLVTVVEAVIAAPLAIILMVTPEGEGISGTRLERAIQLLAMSILKPSLMILGLITAIAISGVAFGVLNEFIFQAAEHVLHGGIFDFVAMMIIYTMTTLQLSKLIIGVMHRLPDQILEWFSAGMGRSFGESEVGQTLEQGSSEMKGTMGSMNGKLMEGVTSSLRDRKKAKMFGGQQSSGEQ